MMQAARFTRAAHRFGNLLIQAVGESFVVETCGSALDPKVVLDSFYTVAQGNRFFDSVQFAGNGKPDSFGFSWHFQRGFKLVGQLIYVVVLNVERHCETLTNIHS